jgi:hypothetical protein
MSDTLLKAYLIPLVPMKKTKLEHQMARIAIDAMADEFANKALFALANPNDPKVKDANRKNQVEIKKTLLSLTPERIIKLSKRTKD